MTKMYFKYLVFFLFFKNLNASWGEYQNFDKYQSDVKNGESTNQFLDGGNADNFRISNSDKMDIIPEQNRSKKVESSREQVLETQHTTCQITTEELVATAQATVTRVLKGLCVAKDMEERFMSLESQVTEQLNIIKTMIMNLEDRLIDQEDNIMRGQRKIMGSLARQCINGLNNGKSKPAENRLVKPEEPQLGLYLSEETESKPEVFDGPRETEVLRYNSSIHMEPNINGGPRKVFTYYWRIRHINYKLSGWSHDRYLRSQSFYVFPKGYRMYLRVYPHATDNNFYIHVGITKGEFDDTLKWPFALKHRVHLLDQTKNEKMFEDISSRIWDPKQLCSEFNWQKPTKGDNYECVRLGFPNDLLRQRDYIYGDTIIIKLTVYLEN